MKPILFNTEMVRAILDGRKTVTRRVVSQRLLDQYDEYNDYVHAVAPPGSSRDFERSFFTKRAPYSVGDILYVRETWYYESHMHDRTAGKPDLSNGLYSHRYVFKASSPDYPVGIGVGQNGWRPSIHMSKEAARIFLRVTGVRAERLQEIDENEASREGLSIYDERCSDEDWTPTFYDPDSGGMQSFVRGFRSLWNSTIKPSDIDRYGWNANPWVWVIEFERCEKPQEVTQ